MVGHDHVSTAGAAIVTGGASGIGFATARTLATSGWDVTIAGRRSEALADAIGRLRESAPNRVIASLAMNVAEPADAEALVTAALQTHGRLDAFVNCAGVQSPRPFTELSADDWREMLDVHVRGAALCCAAAARHMREHSAGRIVLVGSVDGILPSRHNAHYSAAKAATHSLTRSMAAELAPYNVLVNAVAPGWVETPMADGFQMDLAEMRELIPLGRPGAPEEVANLIRYLVSEAPALLVGAVIVIDGGVLSSLSWGE
jgi:NAD(P)-dependent dehydrogenase (short-subunit alcohol dehydrogenase family)